MCCSEENCNRNLCNNTGELFVLEVGLLWDGMTPLLRRQHWFPLPSLLSYANVFSSIVTQNIGILCTGKCSLDIENIELVG